MPVNSSDMPLGHGGAIEVVVSEGEDVVWMSDDSICWADKVTVKHCK